MSLALTQRVKDLEKQVAELKSVLYQPPSQPPSVNMEVINIDELLKNEPRPGSVLRVKDGLDARVTSLENKYRMLNARISRKNADVA